MTEVGSAAVVGEAQVNVGVDLQKLLAGLEKAKANTTQYTAEAAKQFLTVESAVTAAGAGFLAYANRAALAKIGVVGLTAGVATLSVGLKNMLGLLGQVGVATAKFAERNPRLAVAGAGALVGSPLLGIAAALSGTAVSRGLGAAGGFALRNPLAALGIGVGGGLLGIAAVSAAAKAGAGGWEALKNAFNETGTSAAKLDEKLAELTKTVRQQSLELPGGDFRDARERRLRGVTGGLTSDLASALGGGGEVSSDVISRAAPALQELTARLGDSEKAFQALGVALRDPARAMEALREAGIAFTADQRRTLEGTRLLTDRLKNAGLVLEVIASQTAVAKRSGFVELMEALGKFSAGALGTASSSIADVLKAIGSGLAYISGLTYVLEKLDEGFRRIGQSITALNKRFFPESTAAELANVREQIASINAELEKLKSEGTGLGGSLRSALDRITGGGATDFARQRLEAQRGALQERESSLAAKEAERLEKERIERERILNDRVQDRIGKLKEELDLLQAGNRAQLDAHRIARELGLAKDDPRVQELARLNAQIEAQNRRINQAGHEKGLTVFERENQQLQQQLKLFKFGNEEMEIRNRLLQIELQAAARKQPLTEAQKQQLLEQMTLLKEIQKLTNTVNEAASAVFNTMGDALAEFATTGKFKFKEFADSVIKQLVRIALQSFVIQPLLNSLTGVTNPLIAGLVGGGKVGSVGGFASGGSFTMPNTGGSGDKPYLIGLSAGERVNVQPAGQRGAPNSGQAVTVINNVRSSKDFEVSSTTSRGPNNEVIIEQVFSEVMKKIGRGDGDSTFGARFGVQPKTVQR